MDNYSRYRGKCKDMSEAAVAADPSLTLVRGHYICPVWGEQQHWWTTRPDGSIYDPTALQFPSEGAGVYIPFDGIVYCDQCGKGVSEAEAYGVGRYAYCSGTCYGRAVL